MQTEISLFEAVKSLKENASHLDNKQLQDIHQVINKEVKNRNYFEEDESNAKSKTK